MHKAIPFYNKLCLHYSVILKAIVKGTFNNTHECWKYWEGLAKRFGYEPNQNGVKALKNDLLALELI